MRDVNTILYKYKKNMDEQQKLDKSLFEHKNKTEWKCLLEKRAKEYHRIYTENDSLLQELQVILEQALDKDTAVNLWNEAHKMYWEDYDDCQVLLPILYKLKEYYEQALDEEEAVEKLMFVYAATYYEESEVQNLREGSNERSEEYNYKILEWKDCYCRLNREGRLRIWKTYYNLIVSALENKSVTPEESFRLYKEAISFWNSDMVKTLDGEDKEFCNQVDTIKKEWLIIESFIESCSTEMQNMFCDLAKEMYEKELQEYGNIYAINSEVYAAHLYSMVLRGEKSVGEIVDLYYAYYKEKIELCPEPEEISEEDFYFILNTPLTIARWAEKEDNEKKRKTIMAGLKGITQESWYQKLEKYDIPMLNNTMAEWCFAMLEHMDNQAEKEECVFRLIIRRQLSTYLHSVMVARLAEAVFKEAMKKKPALFSVLENMNCEEQISYIRQCALLHDVGKTQITDIVNTQGRRLTDREFGGIKKHPKYGYDMLFLDSDLAKYKDIAMGHHKFYNGKSGYPMDFDNVNSPYRSVIDLITICDCIDAATDYLTRNYKSAKSMEQMVGELVEGKGTRYNPQLVELIENSPRLIEELCYIVNDGRVENMYTEYVNRVC